jgi:hypothetical protein
MSELDRSAALREENARLATAVCFLERCQEQTNTECDRLRAQVAALEQLVEDYRLSAKAQHQQAVEARAQVAALVRFKAAYDICDGHRGAFSCNDQHDLRCLKARGKPDAKCECGRDELDAAEAALAALDAVE